MKNNFMYLFSILLIGTSSIESSQEAVSSGSLLPRAYQELLDKIIEKAVDTGNTKQIDLFQKESDTIETILSPDASYEKKRDAFLGLLGMKMSEDIAIGNSPIDTFKKNEQIIGFLSECNALDVQGKSGSSSSAKTFFNTLLKEGGVPTVTKNFIRRFLNIAQIQMFDSEQEPKDSQLLQLNELCKDITSIEDAKQIRNPLIRALAASRIVGKYAGDRKLQGECTNLMLMIKNAIQSPNFFNRFPNTWTTLVKQSLDGIAGDYRKTPLSPAESDTRDSNFQYMESGFKASIKRLAARTKASWFREYCSISKLALRACSAFMSDKERYDTTIKLVQSLGTGSKLDPRDVAIKIGIVLRNLSGKTEVAGQPEKLLQALSKTNITVDMINDEIISRVPNRSVTRGESKIGLQDIFNRGLVDIVRMQSFSLDNIETRDAFDPATVTKKTPTQDRNPTKQGSTSTTTESSNRLPKARGSATGSTSEEEIRKQEEEAKKLAAEKLAAEKLAAEKEGLTERPR